MCCSYENIDNKDNGRREGRGTHASYPVGQSLSHAPIPCFLKSNNRERKTIIN